MDDSRQTARNSDTGPIAKPQSGAKTVASVVRAYIDSWSASDPRARAALFRDDAMVVRPDGSPPLVGLLAIEAWWRDIEDAFDAIDLWLIDLVDRGQEGLFVFESTLRKKGGPVLGARVYEQIEIDGHGLIRRLKAWRGVMPETVGIGTGPI